MSIKTLSFGCRLNALETEKIQKMLQPHVDAAIIVNTCAVTHEAERQSAQAIRKLGRENPNTPIFVTGCAATRNPELFTSIPNAIVVHNRDKMQISAYLGHVPDGPAPSNDTVDKAPSKLSKQFVQVQNGCNHQCTYCVTRLLRGPAVSFEYETILADVRAAVENGFGEIVLTGIDIASYVRTRDGSPFLISDLCRNLLADVPGIQRLRLSSMDPASPEIYKIIDLMNENPKMMRHMHLSMQSGSDTILAAMRRRHNAARIRDIAAYAQGVTFSWDIICGFPGETDERFMETMELIRETRPIKIHAFPFSPRPDTAAADMPDQVSRDISRRRVKVVAGTADDIRAEYMQTQIGRRVQVLAEENNIARTPDDIPVRIVGTTIPARTICDVTITGIDGDAFIGHAR